MNVKLHSQLRLLEKLQMEAQVDHDCKLQWKGSCSHCYDIYLQKERIKSELAVVEKLIPQIKKEIVRLEQYVPFTD